MRWSAMLLCLGLAAAPAFAQDSSALFIGKSCNVCHSIGVDPPDDIGPHLNGIVGRPVSGLDEYDYSQTLRRAGADGQVWTRELLLRFLKKPAHVFPGTKMNYAGMADRAEIEALIDYLAGFAPDGGTMPW